MSKRVRIQSRVTHPNLGTGTMISERWSPERLYEGMDVKVSQQHYVRTQFVQKGIATTATGIVRCYVGDTQDIVNDDLTTEVRTVSTVSGRNKPVQSKKAQGELRRKRYEAKALSFGVSQSKAYHKAKHS